MGVWLKHIPDSFSVYISIFSGRGGWNLGAGTKIVGVAAQNGRGQNFSRASSLLKNLATMQ